MSDSGRDKKAPGPPGSASAAGSGNVSGRPGRPASVSGGPSHPPTGSGGPPGAGSSRSSLTSSRESDVARVADGNEGPSRSGSAGSGTSGEAGTSGGASLASSSIRRQQSGSSGSRGGEKADAPPLKARSPRTKTVASQGVGIRPGVDSEGAPSSAAEGIKKRSSLVGQTTSGRVPPTAQLPQPLHRQASSGTDSPGASDPKDSGRGFPEHKKAPSRRPPKLVGADVSAVAAKPTERGKDEPKLKPEKAEAAAEDTKHRAEAGAKHKAEEEANHKAEEEAKHKAEQEAIAAFAHDSAGIADTERTTIDKKGAPVIDPSRITIRRKTGAEYTQKADDADENASPNRGTARHRRRSRSPNARGMGGEPYAKGESLSSNGSFTYMNDLRRQEKEIYEYIPDPATAVAFVNRSEQEQLHEGRPYRVRGATSRFSEVSSDSLDAEVAYETFRGKTYKSTVFDKGFLKGGRLRRRGDDEEDGDGDDWADGEDEEVAFEMVPSFVLASKQLGRRQVASQYEEGGAQLPQKAGRRSVHAGGAMSPTAGAMTPRLHMQQMIAGGADPSIITETHAPFETPVSRLRRLQFEINELQEFVSSFVIEENTASQDGGTTFSAKNVTRKQQRLLFGKDPFTLLAELEELRAEITCLSTNPKLHRTFSRIEPIAARQNGYDIVWRQLKKVTEGGGDDLDEAPKAADGVALDAATAVTGKAAILDGTTKDAGTADSALVSVQNAISSAKKAELMRKADKCIYEVYSVPSLKPLMETNRLVNLEGRIAEVEGVIGISKAALLPYPDIQNGIIEISKKINLLDPQRLESLSKRAQTLIGEMHSLQSRKKEISGEGQQQMHEQRVEALYELCSRWRRTTSTVPIVVDRLRGLKSLHQAAGGVHSRLEALETQQAELAEVLESTHHSVDALDVAVTETFKWTRRSVEHLHECMKKLSSDPDSYVNAYGMADEKDSSSKVASVLRSLSEEMGTPEASLTAPSLPPLASTSASPSVSPSPSHSSSSSLASATSSPKSAASPKSADSSKSLSLSPSSS